MSDQSIQAIQAILVIIFLITYVMMCYFTYAAAKRLGATRAWMAWIPIANIFLMSKMANRRTSEFWLALILGLFCGLVLFVFEISWWMEIARRLNRSSWIGVFAAFPFIGFIFMGIIAFSTPSYQYVHPYAGSPTLGMSPAALQTGTPKPMFCKWCGGTLVPDAKFCGSCGQPVQGNPFS